MECNKDVDDNSQSDPFTDKQDPDHTFSVALDNYTAAGDDQLSFKKGQRIEVLKRTNDLWWWAELDGNHGYVPANHMSSHQHEVPEWQDEEYFGSYGNLKLHHEMLSDKPRTLAYRDAIVKNAANLEGKVVLDIGCGTGILSMMCVHHGGVRKVYAVEASEIANSTQKLVDANSFSEQVYAVEASEIAQSTQKLLDANSFSEQISVIHDYAENVKLEEKVDLIISEWMGTILMFEMMIESVILMRDQFLRESGTIWPSQARLYMVPCAAHAQYRNKVDFWDTVYGFDFSVLKPVAKDDLLLKPVHDYVLPAGDCLSQAQTVLELDMKSVSVEDLEDNTSQFSFVIDKGSTLHGFCFWFEAEFCPFNVDGETVRLNTGPEHELTHWKQNLFLLDDPLTVSTGDTLTGSVRIYRHPDFRRHLRVDLKFDVYSGENPETMMGQCAKTFYVWR